jgi:hypothetical protein
MLIKCAECDRDISDTVPACPHCGFARKPLEPSAPAAIAARTAIFQYISLGAVVVALFTPRILLSVPCLVTIIAGIVALVRAEPRKLLSLATVGFAVFLVSWSPTGVSTKSTAYVQNMEIEDSNWTTERNYTYVRGRVKNSGDKTVSYFKITAYYKDDEDNVLDTDYTNSAENLRPGMAKEFEIMHRASPDYKHVSIQVEDVRVD